ncbi:MAG: hypothetical protein QM790_17795 [Nibricoccus sp.]
MRTSKIFILAASILSLAATGLKAEDAPALPAGEPKLTMTFPTPHDFQAVTVAVSKALIGEDWQNLAWFDTTTTATIEHSKATIKVFVVSSPFHVKLYSTVTEPEGVSEEKARKVDAQYLEKLEKRIARELGLHLNKGRGKDGSDVAT